MEPYGTTHFRPEFWDTRRTDNWAGADKELGELNLRNSAVQEGWNEGTMNRMTI